MSKKCKRVILGLVRRGPILVYGEAATGKTLASLLIARLLYRWGLVDDIVLIATEPANTLPSAARILPPHSLVINAFTTFDLLEALLDTLPRRRSNTVLIIDSLTTPFRVDAQLSPAESIRAFTLTLALLHKAWHMGNYVIATSQVHEIGDNSVEPVAARLLSVYFPVTLRASRLNEYTRVLTKDEESIKLLIMLDGEPRIECDGNG